MAARQPKPVPGRQIEPMRAYDPYRPRMFGTEDERNADANRSLVVGLALVGDMLHTERKHASAAATRALAAHDAGRVASSLTPIRMPKPKMSAETRRHMDESEKLFREAIERLALASKPKPEPKKRTRR
jgi:hypothetical protein